ncbi:hypothetical protein AYI68_g8104 [Smittium mucronatum]|uniref:Uncharacterized protein n=1 Tax=Smittium mucronatum TaxID=133383 RepID=A0A1R0GLU8_9FUNG|nr:hypothetical protein AYI68_g8104 [Smittium mucronatum]
MLSKLYRKGTSNFGGFINGKINAAPTAGAEEKILVEECLIDIDGALIRQRNSEYTIMEGPFEEMEWSVVPATSSNLFSVISKPGGCTEPLKGNDRMVTLEQYNLSIEKEARTCAVQLGRLEEPLPLPAPESNYTDRLKDEKRADKKDCNYTRIDIGYLVSRHVSTFDLTTTNSTSNRGNPDPKSGKSPLTKNRDWTLMAWRISGAPSKTKVSPTLQSNLSLIVKNQLGKDRHTTRSRKNIMNGTENDIKTLQYH